MISVTFDSHVYLFTDDDGVFTVGVAIHESTEQASLCGPDGECDCERAYVDEAALVEEEMAACDKYYAELLENDPFGEEFFGEMTVNGREEQRARGAENGVVAMETRDPASVQSADGGDHVERTAVAAAQQQSINLDFIAAQRNKNTTRKLEQTFSRFVDYMLKKGAPKNVGDILSMVPVLLDQYVGGFILDLQFTAKDGSVQDYEPDTLTSYHRGIAKKLEELGYPWDLLRDVGFKTSRDVLAAKRKSLKGKEKGNRPNRADGLSEADEEKMWVTGVMGLQNLEALLNMVWYATSKLLGFRGNHEARQLRWGDFTKVTDNEGGVVHIEWNERLSKTRMGNTSHLRAFKPKLFPNKSNPERCPLAAFKLFEEKQPQSMREPDSPFYLAINTNRPTENSRWFKASPMGVDTIGKSCPEWLQKPALLVGNWPTTVYGVPCWVNFSILVKTRCWSHNCQGIRTHHLSSIMPWPTRNSSGRWVMCCNMSRRLTAGSVLTPSLTRALSWLFHSERPWGQTSQWKVPRAGRWRCIVRECLWAQHSTRP